MAEVTADISNGIDRRTLLTTGGLGAAAIAAGVLTAGPAVAASGGNKFSLRVLAALEGLNLSFYDDGPLADADPGPFYIPGEIFEPGVGGATIGEFHCWGFFFVAGGALGVVSQEYHLFGRGKILVAGVEDEGPRAVTGGTGDFRNVRGEMTGADLSGFPDFTVDFRLIG